MPHDLPNWSTVYDYFRQWRQDGTWEKVLLSLRREVRQREGREPEPNAAIIDTDVDKLSRGQNLSPIFAIRPGLRASNRTKEPVSRPVKCELCNWESLDMRE